MDSAERGDCGRCSSRSCQCIGEEFWRREDVIEALRIRDACALIRLARRYTDLTQQELAEITGLTQPMISLIERGKTRRLGRERQQRALHGLEARATLLPPMEEWGDSQAMAALEAVSGEGPNRAGVNAAQISAYVMLWARAASAPPAPPRKTAPVTPAMVAALEDVTEALRRADAAHGSAGLAPFAAAQLTAAQRMLAAAGEEGVRRRLYRAAADLAGLAGWLAVDAGDYDRARPLFAAALRSAHQAGDVVLGAGIASSVAVQSYSLGQGLQAALIARTALERTVSRATPLVRAMLHTRVARGHAVDGDRLPALRALENAREAFEQGPSDEDPSWLYWMSPGEMHGQAAAVHLSLGEDEQALQLLEQADRTYDSACVRDHARCTVRSAGALARLGELDHACERAHRALDMEVGSVRLAYEVMGLLSDLEPYGDEARVAELRDHAAPLLDSALR